MLHKTFNYSVIATLHVMVVFWWFAVPSAAAAANDYVWLHVEGKYIKTSPSANPPNQIFVAAGVAMDQLSGQTSRTPEADAIWAKGKGCNIVRFSINTLPKPQGNNTAFGTCANALTQFIDPRIQAFKNHQLYVFLDQHEYFHAYNSGVGLARAEVLPINSGEGQCFDLWYNGQIVRKKRGRFKKDGGETLCARCRAKRRVH
jgi:hypothetical protein